LSVGVSALLLLVVLGLGVLMLRRFLRQRRRRH
jgi:hypothetical protein